MTIQTPAKYRIQSIDVLRGIVIVIMALDHARDFFYKADIGSAGAVATDPTNMATTTPGLFFTRWITHFCAPVFVFLSGTSAFLVGQRKSKKELSLFLIKRGFWLVFVEIFIITLGWTFDPLYHLFILQVIWAIGVSMTILGLMVHLPFRVLLAIGLLIVCGHHLLDTPAISSSLKGNAFADMVYYGQFSIHKLFDDHFFIVVYSFLPWTGIMLLGYCAGRFFTPEFPAERRRKILVRIGLSLFFLFIVLRYTNLYGDPVPWSTQPRGSLYTFLSFLNVNKYPPSMLFVCITLGPALFLLAHLESFRNRFTGIMNVYGRVPMFFYILHMYLIHALVVILFFATGHTSKEIVTPNNPFLFRPSDLGFGLTGVYLVWLFVVVVLFPLCRKYDRYKSSHHHWWLSYL